MTQPRPDAGATGPPEVHVTDPAVATAYGHLHVDTVRVLRDWDPPGEDQAGLRAAYLAHLAAHPDGVAKAGPPAHVTASCLVLDPNPWKPIQDDWFIRSSPSAPATRL